MGYEPSAWTARISDEVVHALAISSMPMQIVTLEPEMPAVLLGERNAEDAVLGEQLLDVLRILSLLVDLGRSRGDLVLDELADRVPNRDLLFREVEVHDGDYRASAPPGRKPYLGFRGR